MGLRTLISDDKHAKWHTQCHQIIFNQSYVTYEYRALQLFSIMMVPVWCSYLCRGRKNLTMPEKNFDFFLMISLVLIRYDYQKFADWMGNWELHC